MSTATLHVDTHQAIKDLMAAGKSEKEAEAIVTTVRNLSTGEHVSKSDIAEIKAEITEVKADVSELRAEMYKAMAVQTLAIIGGVVGLLQLL